jgi:hypothetical protein
VLLLTNSTSVGKFLYSGELEEETHLKSKETHSLIQGKRPKDPGCLMITCSIRGKQFGHALCDFGASVSVMPKVIFDQRNFTHLTPMSMHLQLADSSVHYPEGIVEDVPIKI